MTWLRASTFLAWAGVLFAALVVRAQPMQIGIIDFYGLGPISPHQVREALTFKEGDGISFSSGRPPFLVESERRLAALPGVRSATVNPVCCEAGKVIVYVGLEGKDQPPLHLNPPPASDVRLPPDLVKIAETRDDTASAAVQRGDAAEDDSQGHALFHDPASRLIQDRFVGFAATDLPQLRRVLRESGDADQRAIAAQVIGYAADKQTVVDDLVRAMHDSSADVRNNAMRALLVFTRKAQSAAQPPLRIPYEPFIELLNSPVWTDRNKSSLAMMELSESRDSTLLAELKRETLPSLIDMARWRSEGHAIAAFLILGRIAGMSDESVKTAWDRGERERVIDAARAAK